jgi:phage shock protein A
MNVWAKMMTALRGGVNEVGEAVVDSQALRILDQEMRDASEELKQSKDSLAEIIARQKLAEEKSSGLKKHVIEYEGYALKALEKNDDALALEVAEKISELEQEYDQEQSSSGSYKKSATALLAAIKQTEQNLKRLKQQVDTVKATESVQRAQAAVAKRHSGTDSKMRTAMDSLQRIKEKQDLKAAKMSAADELTQESKENSLKSKLEDAGIITRGSHSREILDKLKIKKSE